VKQKIKLNVELIAAVKEDGEILTKVAKQAKQY